ncbi:hypothetical protein KTD31_02985 [Burkholderia multivorans]|uniref:hypothetical protein n=1 Tax=Burkholderia multivorans TaxID=87883 RepID=UPI001C224A29|nr:hypothetical protein [Burkholderia multivorans]MBU9200317.1 hypothetical protein [Burkholderia multivorans]MDN8078557.1 hypothetical protein [Burkholderia multivorans]
MFVTDHDIRLLLEQLIERNCASRVGTVDESDFYNRTYPLQLAEFARLRARCAWTVDDVLMRFSSVYGWMPRGIQRWNTEAVPSLVTLLNEDDPDERHILIKVASRCINNSVVGASKFLHFFDPDCFPIFDSVVASLWWPDDKKVTLARYEIYWAGAMMVSDRAVRDAQAWARHWLGYDVSGMRAVESMAFYIQRRSRKGHPPGTVTQSDEDD